MRSSAKLDHIDSFSDELVFWITCVWGWRFCLLQSFSSVESLCGPSSGQYSGQPVDVPQNHKRAVCDLTVADRLALYDHVVGVFSQEKQAASSSNEDLYVDLVSKLQKSKTLKSHADMSWTNMTQYNKIPLLFEGIKVSPSLRGLV